MAGWASGARPRLVCNTTPVALITGPSEGTASRSTRDRIAVLQPSGGALPPVARAASMVSRTARTTRLRGPAAAIAATAGPASRASTAGRRRRGPVVVAGGGPGSGAAEGEQDWERARPAG